MRSLLIFLSGVVVVVLIEVGRSSPPSHAEVVVQPVTSPPVTHRVVAEGGIAAPSGSEREIASLSARLAALEASAASAPSVAPDAGAPAGEERRASPPSADELLGRLEDVHDGQRDDPIWSREAEGDINDAFAAFGAGELLSVSCRSTLCRLELGYRDIADFDRFLTTAPQMPPFDTEGFFQRLDSDPDSDPTFVVFIARRGHELASGR